VSGYCLTPTIQLYHGENKLNIEEMMMFHLVLLLDQYAELDFYSAISLKQQC
jgi:hypothetical protein